MEKTFLDEVTNIMAVNVKVFGAFVKNRILGDVMCSPVITKKRDGEINRKPENMKQPNKTDDLTGSARHTAVLTLGGGLRNSLLFLGFP